MKNDSLPKLVRDRIPELISASGKTPVYRILNYNEYRAALEKKLDEEVAEFHDSPSLEELADILEVVFALCEVDGHAIGELLDVHVSKIRARGRFLCKILLEDVHENQD